VSDLKGPGSIVAVKPDGSGMQSLADSDGNLYVAMYGQGRVLVFNKNGIPMGQVLLPGRDENCPLESPRVSVR
jgi:lactonase